MNYFELFSNDKEKTVGVGVVGANGGFGYSFLAQIPLMASIQLKVVCDLDVAESVRVLTELGYDPARFKICRTPKEMQGAKEHPDAIIILDDSTFLASTDIDVLVESTGAPEQSASIAEACLLQDISVCMVSKETDSVVGPYLYRLAKERDLVYTTVNGDQPANLIQLFTWAKTLGLEIIVAGKSSEYDFVYDPETKEFSYLGRNEQIQELAKHWHLNGPDTLEMRKKILSGYPQSAVPDYCEMNVVSNIIGFLPACDAMHYPICRIEELAEVFLPSEEGGILEKAGVVDVFINLRRPDEASFAGGVFVIVSCHNDQVWQLLQEKGHVVGRNRKYACMYLPYHFMGVEAPISVLLAGLKGFSSSAGCSYVSKMIGKTSRDFKKGEILEMKGHHHVIEGIEVALVPYDSVEKDIVPFYLAAGKVLLEDVPAGTYIQESMIDLDGSTLYRMLANEQ